MSARASRIVWAARMASPSAKLTLLALADHLRDETGQLNPSLQTLADEVGVSRSQVQRIVRELIAGGLVSVVANRFGGKPGSTPNYLLHLDRIASLPRTGSMDAIPTDSTDAAPTGSADATRTGSMDAEDGQHGCTGGAAPMRETGSTDAAQTTKNNKGTTKEQATPRAARRRSDPDQSAFQLPAWIPNETWADFVAMRRSIRKPMTAAAMKLQVKKLETLRADGHSPRDVLEQSIAGSWQGLFPIKADTRNGGAPVLSADEVFEGAR